MVGNAFSAEVVVSAEYASGDFLRACEMGVVEGCAGVLRGETLREQGDGEQ